VLALLPRERLTLLLNNKYLVHLVSGRRRIIKSKKLSRGAIGVTLFASVIVLLLSPFLATQLYNNFLLHKWQSQLDRLEELNSIEKSSVMEKSAQISFDPGSGNYCVFTAQRVYSGADLERLMVFLARYDFYPAKERDDDMMSKTNVFLKSGNVHIYLEDGPHENVFDTRCG